MDTLKQYIIVLTALSLSPVGWAAAQDKPESPLRLELDLVDGSCIIGIPGIKSIPIQTPYAKMDIPLKQIASVKIEDDRETASFELSNGDKLKGVFDIKPLQLETVFGQASVSIEHVTRIAVLPGASPLGLVLHYSFDKDDGDTIVDSSGRQHHGTLAGGTTYEDAVAGKGIKTSSKDTYVICRAPELTVDGWRQLTVTAWVKLSRYATYGNLVNRGKEGAGGGFGMSVGGVYGGKPYDGGFSVRLGEKRSVSVKVKRFADLNQWYHVAGVYDGRTVTYYVDGNVIASTDVPDELRNEAIKEDSGTDLVVGKSAGRRSWLDTHINGMIDEVMIFDHALPQTRIRQIYNSQK
jgi:hypothetical protein